MGQAIKVKGEYLEVNDLVDLIGVLKDVADMRFHSLTAQKLTFQRFNESFSEFFRLIGYSQITHPLVVNDNPNICFVALTTEEGFVGDLNTKVIERVNQEMKEYPEARVIVVGRKGAGKLEQLGIPYDESWTDLDEKDPYDMSIMVKDHLVKGVLEGTYGKVSLVYPWPKDLSIVKPKVVKLLPCDFIVEQQEIHVEKFTQLIEESDPVDIIGYLADLWLSSRIYAAVQETRLAAAAAQTQQLESSLDKMKKEEQVVRLKYRKAKKGDIDSSLREVFSARLMSKPS